MCALGRSTHDYAALKLLFIRSDPSTSVRAFAAEHNVPWSALNVQVNKKDANGKTWRDLRDEFHAQATEKAITVAGDKLATKIMEVREDAINAIHAMVLKMVADTQDLTYTTLDGKGNPIEVTRPGQVVTPDHVSKLIKDFLLLTGNATSRHEERSESVSTIDFGQLGEELTRTVADIARKRGADARPVERPRLPGARVAGPN